MVALASSRRPVLPLALALTNPIVCVPALALTGGIAAPAVAAVFGAVGSAIGIGGALTAMGSATAVSIMFGAAGAGLAGHSVAKRTGDIKVCRGLHCLSCRADQSCCRAGF